MRGGISYVTLMVLNPIIILFYQNCSFVPSERAMAHQNNLHQAAKRVPASLSTKSGPPAACLAEFSSCPQPE